MIPGLELAGVDLCAVSNYIFLQARGSVRLLSL